MERLRPSVELLAKEFVLVQAWKKTAEYIRYHNWFADTLELDRTTANLPAFISDLSSRLQSGSWSTDPLRLVAAPKSQRWAVNRTKKRWEPAERTKIRPLAHASLADQVAATAVLLCLSERVETRQGDPRADVTRPRYRKSVTSYGNRLFCDTDPNNGDLIHRWGSSKLYRGYFADYRTFLARSESVAADCTLGGERVAILQSDLRQFYDRVRPAELGSKLIDFRQEADEVAFFDLSSQILNWNWHKQDRDEALRYAKNANIEGYDEIALPQGLVAAGFFSNVVMISFDEALRTSTNSEIAPGVTLKDSCRYVDDLRLTLSLADGVSVADAEERSVEWLSALLEVHSNGLQLAPEKTKAAAFGGEEQRLVRQSRKMERIQAAISGGFDATGGEEVIQAIEALLQSQAALAKEAEPLVPAAFTTITDVRDETLGRFAAARYRTTFRSLRPLLEDRPEQPTISAPEDTSNRTRLSQTELDEGARVFALGLIKRWMENPANVRLLRVGLDLWPSPEVLASVLGLLEPYLEGQARSLARKIAFYCLAEILRAGATETGFVTDPESFPEGVDLEGYRRLLRNVAVRIATSQVSSAPWYLKQQALLFLAAYDPAAVGTKRSRSTDPYRRMIQFLIGDHESLDPSEFAVESVVARRSFLDQEQAVRLLSNSITPERLIEIAGRDIDLARDLWRATDVDLSTVSGVAEDLGAAKWTETENFRNLRTLVSKDGSLNSLRNEIGVLSFAKTFLNAFRAGNLPELTTPDTVQVKTRDISHYSEVLGITFRSVATPKTYRSIYTPPSWADKSSYWRFQLGFLLRYILTARVDFSIVVRKPSWKEVEKIYRPTRSHWLQRQYGFYNGHEAFGDDWLPISQFVQDLLFALLSWPGCRVGSGVRFENADQLASIVDDHLAKAKSSVGKATGTLILNVDAPIPGSTAERPLRGCVVQTVTPEPTELLGDPELNDPAMRRKHRNHLSTALAAVEKMLDLRETHRPQDKRLDWLIFPELSVHPADVSSHLLPFARAHKTAILAGLTYERLVAGQLLVNSALWIIPTVVPGHGLHVIVRRQGKRHLSPMELPMNQPIPQLEGFRPCQWLIGYQWSRAAQVEPLWLTGSICYDATDLCLAADLKSRSDVFAVPSLNRDVGTFDLMAQALHYHMYQLVIVANNGVFGGSNAHMPKGEAFQRQIFHTHGQPQASISFFEIDDIADMKARRASGLAATNSWKYPPAAY